MYLSYEIFIFFFMVLSAFFSATETSIISADRIRLRASAEKGNLRAKRSLQIIEHIEDAVGMTLIGNNIVNIASAAFITFLAVKHYVMSESSILIISTIQTVVFLIFCEIMPKIIGRAKADAYIMFFSTPISFLIFILKPAIRISLLITLRLNKLFKFDLARRTLIKSRDEMGVLFNLGESEGIIDKSHQVFVDEILSLHEVTAYEVMTPIIDVVSIEKRQPIKSLVNLIGKTRYSRIPVHEDRVDNVIGYIYYRDLLERKKLRRIEDILRKPYFVPTTKKINEIFQEMYQDKLPLVFVVNEFGGVEGLITTEDIVEELVGEIQTRDHANHDLIKKINKRRFRIHGSIDIDFFQRRFNITIEKKGFETLAGFINYKFGKIPVKGDKIKYHDHIMIIDEATDKSVEMIILVLPQKKQ